MPDINIIPINSIHMPELEPFIECNETQLLHYFEPELGVFIAESPIVIERALDSGYEPLSLLLDERDVTGEAKNLIERLTSIKADMPIYVGGEEQLKDVTGFKLTRGSLCLMRRKSNPDATKIIMDASRIVIMDDVTNPTNIGAIIRSAVALGADAILTTKSCADPLYRRSLRTCMGTIFMIPWSVVPDDYLGIIRGEGFKTVAMALRDDSYNIDSEVIHAEPKLAIIMGNEGHGLADEKIAGCDYTVKIPMYHGVDSLNVAAASAVAMWELCRRGV